MNAQLQYTEVNSRPLSRLVTRANDRSQKSVPADPKSTVRALSRKDRPSTRESAVIRNADSRCPMNVIASIRSISGDKAFTMARRPPQTSLQGWSRDVCAHAAKQSLVLAI